jgi:ParB family transcriptional regulator, chromosome partitioning protein
MEKKSDRRGLGRGLSALLADVNPPSPDAVISPDAVRATQVLAVERVQPNPNQPRRAFAADALDQLAQSIRQKGIVQPLIVRSIGQDGQYEIVAGERRWRAAQIAGLHEVPVVVRDFDDVEVLEIAIIENIQREDLNPIEEALAYRQLIDRFGHTQEKLAEALSRSRSHVTNLLRLLTLPGSVQDLLTAGALSAGHARALVSAPNPAELAMAVVKRGLSVRETERLAKTIIAKPARANRKPEKDADTRAIEADLSANLHMMVNIEHGRMDEGGVLTIKYRTLDDLDLLCDVLSKIPRDMMDGR